VASLVEQIRDRVDLTRSGIVAVSGGPDSVALLRALHGLRPSGGLMVAHFQHRLRGEEGDADAPFVAELAASLGLPFTTAAADVRGVSEESGENLEAAARRLRYAWLTTAAREAGAGWVATGHTADDQAETVLHRIIRGAGIQGLRGIAAERELAEGIALIRPMLAVSRVEVMAYLESLGQSFRIDASNRDLRFTRNRIRHELLPQLRSYNPAIETVLTHLAEQAAELYREQEQSARELLHATEFPRAGPLCILDARQLAAAPRHRVREVFRLVWGREGWPLGEMSFDHWNRVVAVARGERTAADLPGGVRIRQRSGVVQVGSSRDDRPGLSTTQRKIGQPSENPDEVPHQDGGEEAPHRNEGVIEQE
jgi:tRNA(Ile)-lysidine synthase